MKVLPCVDVVMLLQSTWADGYAVRCPDIEPSCVRVLPVVSFDTDDQGAVEAISNSSGKMSRRLSIARAASAEK